MVSLCLCQLSDKIYKTHLTSLVVINNPGPEQPFCAPEMTREIGASLIPHYQMMY